MKHSDEVIEEIENIINSILIIEPNVYGGFKRDYESWKQYSIAINIEKNVANYREKLQKCYFMIMYLLNTKFGFLDFKMKETGNKYVKTINIRIKYD